MIKVTVIKDNTVFTKINITGHANSKKFIDEFDAICTSVCSIYFGILNKLSKDKFDLELKLL